MKRVLLAAIVLAASLGLIARGMLAPRVIGQGPGPSGPGDDVRSVLKVPFSDPPANLPPSPNQPRYPAEQPNPNLKAAPAVKMLWQQNQPDQSPFPNLTPTATVLQQKEKILAKIAPREGPDPNQDILVHPGLGQWMICLISYSGNESPAMARKMVVEMRSTYRLNAFIFNYGQEEKRREYERVRAEIDRQINVFKQNNVSLDQPLRVPHQRIEDQVAVLVGGYPTEEAAKRMLDKMKDFKPPSPDKVHMHTKFGGLTDPNDPSRITTGEHVYVNPFKRAFLVSNPTTKVERPKEWDQLDIAVLRKMNADEDFSLLKCKKPITLAVKHFRTPTVVQPKSSTGQFLESLGLGNKTNERTDAAAESAHNLAELLRKSKLDAYVLHTKFLSVVTVGGYESHDDPALRATQNLFVTRLNEQLKFLDLFPTPVPMFVPK